MTEESDDRSIPKPESRKLSLYENAVENIFGQEIDEMANISWHIRKVTNNHKQAKNLNALDEVPNSTWFTNRTGKSGMTPEEIKRGPNQGLGPNLTGDLTIVAAKVEGASPGFRVQDKKGDVYFIKFDLKGFPQLNTAAEVITTKLIYAAGYNTPENYLTVIDPKQLQIAEKVMVKNRWGREVPMTFDFVQKILDKAHRNPGGTYRAVASKLLAGKVIGPFEFEGRRKDDPNDHIPHHHRRELRGLQVIAAWLNMYDTKASNTLDMYVTENGRSFVRHYLIDFGNSLGSKARGPAGPGTGKAGAFDLGRIVPQMLTLGFWVRPWESEGAEISPSTGYYTAKYFSPGDYAFIIPNPAFQKATELDGFWGAKIVMGFTDEQIRAAVETGQYENPEDAEYIISGLIERRDKTGRYWFGKVNPLDNFHFSQTSDHSHSIAFDDLSVEAGFEAAQQTTYGYKLRYEGKDLTHERFSKGVPVLTIDASLQQIIEAAFAGKAKLSERDKILSFEIQTRRGESGWSKKTWVYFYYPLDAENESQIIALEREN